MVKRSTIPTSSVTFAIGSKVNLRYIGNTREAKAVYKRVFVSVKHFNKFGEKQR